jgi:CspA family cold shock protein
MQSFGSNPVTECPGPSFHRRSSAGCSRRICSKLRREQRLDLVGERVQGRIKWFNNSKGYSFIGRDDGADVFVHYSGIPGDGYRTLQEGDSVEFDLVQGPKGPQAANVTKLNGATE